MIYFVVKAREDAREDAKEANEVFSSLDFKTVPEDPRLLTVRVASDGLQIRNVVAYYGQAQLRCNYTKQPLDPPLHSVKWYRGTHEIFRYTPQEYETRAFNTSGVYITNSSCDSFSCAITLRPEPGTAKYTCEVSSEGPRFAVDRKSTNMTLAVLPEYEPLIIGLPTYVNAGEQALVNCTSDHTLPAAMLDWFVDSELQEGVPQYTVPGRLPPAAPSDSLDAICPLRWGPTYAAFTGTDSSELLKECRLRSQTLLLAGAQFSLSQDPVVTGATHVSGADGDGLRASWRTLHVFPDDYATHRGFLSLECRATLPTRPPHIRSMAVRLYVESRPHISSPMLSKTNAAGKSNAMRLRCELYLWTLLLLARRQVPLLVK
ncbi:jg17524 [Pararge aegeria aegeria]|uniref:Jg17524 protein n=1 Tax=Pararge aegeria aegeria TaxID=348720 RepID=A0A8S4S937_9NEOP|nr:jg17524 [Pararge aegeria aegeria]